MTTTQASWAMDGVIRQVGKGAVVLARMRDRAAVLDALCHPAVLAPDAVGTLADGTVAVTMPRIEGDSLFALNATHGGLSVGECVTLGMAVADALAAMHRVGLSHGDISPSNIVVGRHRLWLVDTMAGACDEEAGTPGFAAPERPQGASAPGDVFSLGKVLQDVVRDSEAERLEAWITPMLHTDPAVRPSAAMVTRALAACAPPEPLEPRAMGVAEAMRAQVVPESMRTQKGQAPPGWGLRRWVVRYGRKTLISALGATFMLGGLFLWLRIPHETVAASSAPMDKVAAQHLTDTRSTGARQPNLGRQTPAIAGIALTLGRYGAVARGDAEALRATTVPGSPAWNEVDALASALGDRRLDIRGLTVTKVHARKVVAGPLRARVDVTYSLSPYVEVSSTGVVPRNAWEQRVVLDMRREGQAWRVWDIEAGEHG